MIEEESRHTVRVCQKYYFHNFHPKPNETRFIGKPQLTQDNYNATQYQSLLRMELQRLRDHGPTHINTMDFICRAECMFKGIPTLLRPQVEEIFNEAVSTFTQVEKVHDPGVGTCTRGLVIPAPF